VNLLLLGGGCRGGGLFLSERGTYVLSGCVSLSYSQSYCPSSTIALSTPKDRTNDSYTIASPDPTKFASSIPVTIASPFSHANDRASCSLDDCIVYPPVLLLFFWDTPGRCQKTYSKTMFFKMQKHKKTTIKKAKNYISIFF
jgi:hypothetical protein